LAIEWLFLPYKSSQGEGTGTYFIDILMTVRDIELTTHRSPRNAISHTLASGAAYYFIEHRPSLVQEFRILPYLPNSRFFISKC
jgi:hypothetical protein